MFNKTNPKGWSWQICNWLGVTVYNLLKKETLIDSRREPPFNKKMKAKLYLSKCNGLL